jgi:hypothetical protein
MPKKKRRDSFVEDCFGNEDYSLMDIATEAP